MHNWRVVADAIKDEVNNIVEPKYNELREMANNDVKNGDYNDLLPNIDRLIIRTEYVVNNLPEKEQERFKGIAETLRTRLENAKYNQAYKDYGVPYQLYYYTNALNKEIDARVACLSNDVTYDEARDIVIEKLDLDNLFTVSE